MAGFTMGEADTLRRAMGKKDRDLMAKQREKFINGCKERGTAVCISAGISVVPAFQYSAMIASSIKTEPSSV